MKTRKLLEGTKPIVLFSLLALLFISCEKDTSCQWTYSSPEDAGDGFQVGTLVEVNMDSDLIAKAVGRICCGKYKELHSMLIYKNGKLILEEYFPGHKYQTGIQRRPG